MSVCPHGVNIFKTRRLRTTELTLIKLGTYIPMGLWTQLLGSGILNIGPHVMWVCRVQFISCTLDNKLPQLSPVGRDDRPAHCAYVIDIVFFLSRD